MTKRPQTTWGPMFGIVNHLGAPWTPRAFWNEAQARSYLKGVAALNPTWKLGRHRIVRVSLTVRTR